MAKFRTNHYRQGRGRGSGGMIVRIGLLAFLVFGLFFLYNLFLRGDLFGDRATGDSWSGSDKYFLPESRTGQVVQHRYFTLSYDEEKEQAEWVAYILTRDELKLPWVKRSDWFEEDEKVTTGSAAWEDYRGSGYDRGHLAPAADRAFSREAMEETFLMSNISPQDHYFNAGIWRELEELTRDWAKQRNKLYVVSGPVFGAEETQRIGLNEVAVPTAFFKVLLDLNEPDLEGIAFIIPNEISDQRLENYAVSIDEAEEITGIDFFPELMTDALEEKLESTFDTDSWEFSSKKYRLRINRWNRE